MRDVSVKFYYLATKVCPRNGFETDLFERTFSSLDISIWNAVRPHCIQNMQMLNSDIAGGKGGVHKAGAKTQRWLAKREAGISVVLCV